jgi:uroporphyrinogen-III decarboxylase
MTKHYWLTSKISITSSTIMSNFFLCIGWNYIVLNFWKHYTHKHPKTSLCYLHYMPWLVAIAICNNWQAMTLSLFCSFMITNSKWAHNPMAVVCKHSIVSAKQRLNNLCKSPLIASAPILYVWSRTFAKPYMRKVFSQLNKLYIYVCMYIYVYMTIFCFPSRI